MGPVIVSENVVELPRSSVTEAVKGVKTRQRYRASGGWPGRAHGHVILVLVALLGALPVCTQTAGRRFAG